MRRSVPRILVIIVTSFLIAISSLFVVMTPFADVITPVAYAGDGIIIDNAAHVCVRPPDVPADYAAWSYSHDKPGRTVTHNVGEFRRWALAEVVYVYDPNAPPESARLLPMKYQPIVCPNRPKPKPIVKPPPPPKKEEKPEEKKPETKGEKVTPKTGVSQAAAAQATPPQAQPEKTAPLPRRIDLGLTQYEHDMRQYADKTLLEQNPENPLVETDSVLPRLTTAEGPHPVLSVVPCQHTKEGCKKGAGTQAHAETGAGTDSADEESALTELAEALALAGAMATMQMNEDLHRPDGKRHGIVGGKDPNGINHPLMQAAVSVVMISAGVLSNPRAFAKSLRQAYKNRAVFVIKEVDEAGMKMGEKFAAKYPLFAADAMNKIGVIAPFKFMKLFTAKMGWRVQAHHILEVKWTGIFTLGDTELMPSVILTAAEHNEITQALREAAKRKPPKTVAKLWDMYKEVYKGKPAWLDAIKSYFGK